MYHVERLMTLQMLNLTFLIHLCVQRQAQARLFHIIEAELVDGLFCLDF